MSQATRSEKTKPKAPEAPPIRLHAEVLRNGNVSMGSYVTQGEDRFIIGSSKRADLVVPHAEVSQIHAMLRLVDSNILLYDLGSEGGTFVEGKKIVERKLTPGEVFEIGGHRVRVNLLDQLTHESGERALFWTADCSVTPDRLEVIRLEDSIVRDEHSLRKGARLHFGRGRREILLAGVKFGDCFLHRKDSGNTHSVEGMLPAGYVAEIYDGKNELVRMIEQEGSSFSFHDKEKVRLVSADQKREILLVWQAQGARVARLGKDAESPILKKTLGSCLAVALFALTVMSYVPLKREVVEQAVLPTTSYERLSMDSAPAPQAAQAEGSDSKEESKSQQAASKADSISSSLSKLLNKKSSVTAETIQQAISNNGTTTARNAVKNANIKSENIAAGSIGGGAVNVNAISAGLSNGSGTKAGSLNGFKGGKGSSIGTPGGTGFGGKGFDMSLGGDEAEALGGLDKSLIAAVVQSNIGQIKHCYERQLIVDPNIFGKVVASWTIDKDGAVSTSGIKKTTMNNKTVENCIAGKIKNWTFPKPKGGGQVLVSYPFLFKSLN